MRYTIETIVKVDGGVYPFLTKCEGNPTGKDFTAYLEKHTASIERYLNPRHPLEEVFAGVPGVIPNAGDRVHLPPAVISRAFRECVRYAATQSSPLQGLPPLHWVRVSVIWAAARLTKQVRYQTIEGVLAAAVLQATKGKGQRHGGDATPFLEQPWVKLYRIHGLGFLLGQADKKYHEALSKADTESFEREILGAIVYLGMALLALEGRV